MDNNFDIDIDNYLMKELPIQYINCDIGYKKMINVDISRLNIIMIIIIYGIF